jgi:hypothetical protein
MTKRSGLTSFRLWSCFIVIVIALGLTFVACKPAQQTEEKVVTEQAPAETETAPAVTETAPAVTETAPAVTETAPAPSSAKAVFSWTPARPGVKVAQVSTGRAAVNRFQFAINDKSITKVSLSIRDENVVKMGIVLADEELAVKDGKVATDAMFGLAAGTRVGNYELPIVAKNAATGEVIGEGIIPFQVVPQGVGGC